MFQEYYVGVVVPFPSRRMQQAADRAHLEEVLQWSFATSSYAETDGVWAFTDERDARILQQFFDAFGIVERAGMRSDPFALWQALSHEFKDDVLRILKRTGRLRPYRTDLERQYLTAVAHGDTREATRLAWMLQIGTQEWLHHDDVMRWQR